MLFLGFCFYPMMLLCLMKYENVSPLTIYCHFCVSQELRRLKEKYEMLAVELEKTKADNVQLYGKIRYVQDYSHEKIVSRGPKKV